MFITKRLLKYKLDSTHALLINTLSGALDIVDSATLAMLERLDAPVSTEQKLPESLEAALRARSYLFDTAEQERECVRRLFEAITRELEAEPIQCAICPTFACNLGCRYCFEGDLTSTSHGTMSSGEVDAAFEAIHSLKDTFHPHSPLRIVLFGGEPLLNRTQACVRHILSSATQHGHEVDVVTNGVEAQLFTEIFGQYRSTVKQVQITLDGPKAIHDDRRPFKSGAGTFDTISKNLQDLLNAGVTITLRINIDDDNVAFLPELLSIFDDKGWTLLPNFSCYIFPVTARSTATPASSISDAELLSKVQTMFQGEGEALPSFAVYGFKVLGHIAAVLAPESISLRMPPLFTYCEANGLRYFAFGPDHLIYPCGQAVGRRELAIGKYYPSLEIERRKCDQWLTRNILTIQACRECPLGTLCGGGCAFSAYNERQSIEGPCCGNCGAVVEAYLQRMRPYILTRYSGELSISGRSPSCA